VRPTTRPRRPRYTLRLGAAPRTIAGGYLRQLFGTARGAETAVRLMEQGLGDTTRAQYERLFEHFSDYCADEGLCALPAETATVILYIGYLADLGTWAESSMQPIFSAINDAHRSVGLDPPAVDSHFLTRTRQGLRRAQAAISTVDSRVPLPAESLLEVTADGEAAAAAPPAAATRSHPAPWRHRLERLRAAAAISLTSLFAGRQDSSVHLRSCDVGVDDEFIWLRLTEKGKRASRVRRVVRLPLRQSPVAGHPSALPRIAALLRAYLAARSDASPVVPEFAFQLSGEVRPTTRSMEGWLDGVLSRLRIAAPPGFAYQGHSLRSLGASAMAAIGVERHIYGWLGGWARGSQTVERDYVDPTVLPTPAAYALYGWALSRQYAAGPGVVVAATVLPDPLTTTPAE
jgi:hypothetical protein